MRHSILTTFFDKFWTKPAGYSGIMAKWFITYKFQKIIVARPAQFKETFYNLSTVENHVKERGGGSHRARGREGRVGEGGVLKVLQANTCAATLNVEAIPENNH